MLLDMSNIPPSWGSNDNLNCDDCGFQRSADFDLFQNQVETIAISPWKNGTFNSGKQSQDLG